VKLESEGVGPIESWPGRTGHPPARCKQ